jgi:hypothetical protein
MYVENEKLKMELELKKTILKATVDELEEAKKQLYLYKLKDRELAHRIDPTIFAKRLESLGWQYIKDERRYSLILQKEKNTELYQATIPLSQTLSDYDWAMEYAAKDLARYLGQELKQVLVELVLASRKTD